MAGRIVIIVAVLLASAACGSDGGAEPVAPGPLHAPWQPVPFTLAGPIVEAVDRTCRSGFDDAFPQHTQLMVVDARGKGHVEAQYAGPDGSEASCIVTIDELGRLEWDGGGAGSGGGGWPVLQAFKLQAVGGYGSAVASSTGGRAGDGIATVLITMPGKPPVTASLANGWYLAWWPADWPPGTKVIGLDSLGRQVAEASI